MKESIDIKLFATLRRAFSVPEGMDVGRSRSVADLIEDIGVPADKVAIIFIDGRHAGLSDTVNPGQTLSLVPPLGGG